jgi:acetyl-CoA synthase
MDLAIIMEVAGRKMQLDFEPVLERQVHYFVNGASGVSSTSASATSPGSASAKTAAEKGFNLEAIFGDILHARFHADFGSIVDKVQVKVIHRAGPLRRMVG